MAVRTVSESRFLIGLNWGKCLDFNLSSSIASFIMPSQIDNVTNYSIGISFYARTIDATARRVLEIGNGYQILLNSSSLQTTVGHSVTNAQANTVAGEIKINTWYRIMVTFNNSDNYPKMYINSWPSTGTNVNKSGTRLSPVGQTAYLGNRAALDRNFDGYIDELVMYSRELTQSEVITDYYTNSKFNNSRVLYFPLDEVSGSIYDIWQGITGTVSDVTQNTSSFSIPSRTAVGTGSSSRYVINNSSSSEKSLLFNGTSTFLTCPVVPSASGFCLAVWYMDIWGTTPNIRICDWESTFDRNGFNLRINANTGLAALTINNASTNTAVITSTTAFVRRKFTWNHAVVTFKTNEAKLYINGALVSTDTSCDMTTNGTAITLGRRSFSSAEFFKGFMKDFLYVNTTIPWTPEQIKRIYNFRDYPPVDCYYKLDNDVVDSSGNGNDGTLTAGAYVNNLPNSFGSRTAA